MTLLQRTTERLRKACSDAGFDVVQPLPVGAYNEEVKGALRLNDLGNSSHLAFVVGNSKALWKPFVRAWGSCEGLRESANPLDDYTVQAISPICEQLGGSFSLRWAHEGGERTVAMQKLAEVAGLAFTSKSHLSIHPRLGPWLGLRAALVVAQPGPERTNPPLRSPCGDCTSHCWPAFQAAIAATQARFTSDGIAASFLDWLRCRDACPVGREHRYSDAQIRYHYLKDRAVLSAEYEKFHERA